MKSIEEMLFTLYRDGEISKDAKSEISSLFADKDKRIAELEEQVEKRKCCGNCKWYKQGYTDGQRHNKLCLQAAKGERIGNKQMLQRELP